MFLDYVESTIISKLLLCSNTSRRSSQWSTSSTHPTLIELLRSKNEVILPWSDRRNSEGKYLFILLIMEHSIDRDISRPERCSVSTEIQLQGLFFSVLQHLVLTISPQWKGFCSHSSPPSPPSAALYLDLPAASVSPSASSVFVWRGWLARYDVEVRQRCWLVLSKRQQEETTQRDRRHGGGGGGGGEGEKGEVV